MFALIQNLRQKRQDVRTLSQFLVDAEQQARRRGVETPGAEHLLLAAINHSDGYAKRAFASMGVTYEAIDDAISQQYQTALAGIGIDISGSSLAAVDEPICSPKPRIYDAQPSAQEVIQRLYHIGKESHQPLTSVHLAKAITTMKNGTAARVFAALGLGADQITAALNTQLENSFY